LDWSTAPKPCSLLRAVNENDDWDDFHSFRRTQRHKKLYGTPMPTGWLDLAEHFDINQF